MARPWENRRGGRRALVARLGAIGVMTLGATAALGVAGALSAAAAPSIAGTGFVLASQANGLQIALFGTKLTGGNASSCVNDGSGAATHAAQVANKNDDGSTSRCDQQSAGFAASEGEGTLLTSSGAHLDQKATEATPGQTNGSASPTCAQGGATPSASPVLLSLGLSCASAVAALDSTGNPSASSMGEVASATVGLNGLLAPILGSTPAVGGGSCDATSPAGTLLNSVCTALSTLGASAPSPAQSLVAGIGQALQNLFNVVSKNSDPTVTVDVGQAKSSVTTTSSTMKAVSQGSALDVAILPGVGCAAAPGASSQPTLAQCAADAATGHPKDAAPLVEVHVSPASTGSAFDGARWTPTATGSVATIHVNIPGDQQVVPVSPNADQTILAGTPLQTTINLGSVATSQTATGATSIAHGAVVNILESTAFPGGSATQGAVSVDLDGTGATGSRAGTAPPAATATGALPPASEVASGTSPTAVHTGAWWSGSMPVLGAIAALGAALIGWPRVRRLLPASRVVSRGHR